MIEQRVGLKTETRGPNVCTSLRLTSSQGTAINVPLMELTTLTSAIAVTASNVYTSGARNQTWEMYGVDSEAFNNLTLDARHPTVPLNTSAAHQSLTIQTVTIGAILALIILFTLVGNGLVITAVVTFRRLRSVTNYFVVSLAVADLTVALLVMPYSLLFEVLGQWNFGWAFCYFWISCDVTCCTASILHLCVISLDRYLAITQPLTYKIKMSHRRALLMICFVWMCSGAISFVPIYLGWFADSDQMELYVDSPECGLYVNKVYAVISSSLSFYLPLIVMVFAYVRIFRIARRQSREMKRQECNVPSNGLTKHHNAYSGRSKKLRRDVKAIKTLGTLMGLFCLCWLPFFLVYLVVPFCSSCVPPALVLSFITWLGYANSFINPCVYAFLNRDFRLAFRKILSCFRLGSVCYRGRHGLPEDSQQLSYDMYEYTSPDDVTRTHKGYRLTNTRLSHSPSISSGDHRSHFAVDPKVFNS